MNRARELPSLLALPWLEPTDAGLVALAEEPQNLEIIRHDPGLLLHIVRFARPTPTPDHFSLSPEILSQPVLAATAAAYLSDYPRIIHSCQTLPEYHRAWHVARIALRGDHHGCTRDAVWTAALLQPLGSYVLASTARESEAVGNTLTIGRRLASRWRLPNWLAVAIGYPHLSPAQATSLGGHAGLMQVLQRARHLAEQENEVAPKFDDPVSLPTNVLICLMKTLARAERKTGSYLIPHLEAQIDGLTAELESSKLQFQDHLEAAKLDALAEFTAGASHEINNPLAVIVGNAQLLQSRELDPLKQKALDTIRRQTRRIHDLLYSARQFARPNRPTPRDIPLSDFLAGAVAEFEMLSGLIDGVRLDVEYPSLRILIAGDEIQLKQALVQLIRNAIDAAGPEGTVRLRTEISLPDCRVVVEDSGPGPSEAALPHLFDPFFSGRSAGRGRGLGLSIAWKYARINQGQVRYAPRPGIPGRFILQIPVSSQSDEFRRSA